MNIISRTPDAGTHNLPETSQGVSILRCGYIKEGARGTKKQKSTDNAREYICLDVEGHIWTFGDDCEEPD
jgi:hypothetical protein